MGVFSLFRNKVEDRFQGMVFIVSALLVYLRTFIRNIFKIRINKNISEWGVSITIILILIISIYIKN